MKRFLAALLVVFIVTLLWSCRQDNELSAPTQSEEPAVQFRAPRLYVVLGSSTAAGVGPGPYDSSWVGRSWAYFKANKKLKADSIINLARSGYTTNDILPAGNRDRNITKALSLKPYAIIINMPSNDIAKGVSVDSQMKNFAILTELAKQQKVVVWVTTSQPRNLSADGRKKLAELRDRVNSVYKSNAIDFWSEIANPDGTINSKYNSGDGIHINSRGHRIFFSRVEEKKVFD